MSEKERVFDRPAVSSREAEYPPIPKQRPTLEKSATMWASIVGIWALTIVLSLPFMLTLLASAGTPVTLALTAVIVLSLPVFWLFGVYNIVVTAIGYLTETDPKRIPYGVMQNREVAIVYPTYNDFMRGHIDRSRQQSHENTHTYIVDDSTDEAVISEIDDYAADDPGVTVVRREGRAGFKAGGINHALETAIDEPFFVLMDADEVLPEEFIETTITYFAGDDIGFVQGNHDYNQETATRFGRHLGVGVDIHWDIYQPPRNAYGFVMLLGHGAIIRRDVWEEIGGFPEIVSEDLGFATGARRQGYKGVFAREVDCLEDFPPDFSAFRRRHKKWTGGSIEYIRKKLPGFVLDSNVPLVERLDVLVPTLQLPLTAVFVAYILAVGGLQFASGNVIPSSVPIPVVLGIVTVGTILSPLYCYVIGLRKHPKKLLHFIAVSTTVYCSVAVTAVSYGIKILSPFKDVTFLTTPKGGSTRISLRAYAGTIAMGFLTVLIATRAGLLVGTAGSTWLLAPFLPLYNQDSLRGRGVRIAALLPACLLFGGVGYGALSMLGLL